jgi:hypothetical protein
MYSTLNIPKANLKIKDHLVWDRLRKKHVKLTPEEWVRQHFVYHLIDDLNWPEGLMASEQKVKYNNMAKRCDIVSYSKSLTPLLIVECKAPKIKLTEDTFYQIAKYNFTVQAPLLILTNGITHINAYLDKSSNEIKYLEKIPTYENALKLTGNF